MWWESCDIPDNVFSGLDITIPEELKSSVVSKTQAELSDCFIESLDLQSGSQEYLVFVKKILLNIWARWAYSKVVFDEAFTQKLITLTIEHFKDSNPAEYNRLKSNPQDSYIIINGVVINFHNKLTYHAPENSLRPQARKLKYSNQSEISEDNVWNIFSWIKDRADVNSVSFFSRVDFLISNSNNNITLDNGENILSEGFKLAFISEMQGVTLAPRMKLFHNLRPKIQAIFRRNITWIGEEYIDKLVFLCIVESNLSPKIVSSAWAMWFWQIMPATWKRYYSWNLNITDALNDPIVSTDIASKYLNAVIQNLKRNFPGATDEDIFKLTLREYNGAWNGRLKPDYRKNVFRTAREIYIQLDLIEWIHLDSNLSEEEKRLEAVGIIEWIQNKYFDNSDLVWYLEKKDIINSFSSIHRWSRKYFSKIIKQQLMYPNQVIWAYQAYNQLYSS